MDEDLIRQTSIRPCSRDLDAILVFLYIQLIPSKFFSKKYQKEKITSPTGGMACPNIWIRLVTEKLSERRCVDVKGGKAI
jgi:hypothetical protein